MEGSNKSVETLLKEACEGVGLVLAQMEHAHNDKLSGKHTFPGHRKISPRCELSQDTFKLDHRSPVFQTAQPQNILEHQEQLKTNKHKAPKGWTYLIIPPTQVKITPNSSSECSSSVKSTLMESSLNHDKYETKSTTPVFSPCDQLMKESRKPPTGWNYLIIPPTKEAIYPSKSVTPSSASIYTSLNTSSKGETHAVTKSTIPQTSSIMEAKSTSSPPLTPTTNKSREDGLRPPAGWNYIMIPPAKKMINASTPTC